MFYIKSGDLYYTGEFDRCLPPNPYLGSFDESLEFKTYDAALNWLHQNVLGGEIIEYKDIPEVDTLKAENLKLKNLLSRARAGLDYNLLAAWGQEDLEEEMAKALE